MSSVASTTETNPYAALNGTASGSAGGTSLAATASGGEDRFLKLLVAQMQNQDPMNPLDNAQVTSQMAQISTVSGIDKLNTTVQSLNAQFVQMQAVQGAALVGHDVSLVGNQLSVDDSGTGTGAFVLAGTADNVTVDILNSAGKPVDTLNLGAQGAGPHDFEWKPKVAGDYTFRVSAKAGAKDIDTTLLMRDRVEAISTTGDGLTLELARSGSVPYSAIKAFN